MKRFPLPPVPCHSYWYFSPSFSLDPFSFCSLSDIFAPLGLFPGGGLCIQKVPFGVTVRQVQFIDDASVSSAARPLYALLISREIEVDQGLLDDDGLSPEERQKIKDEKDKEKTLRQVEADLGGFDVEQEWVEEIERDNYFEVDTTLGRAPPLPKRVFEVWLVDAASGWNVIDSYQLKEVEHGASMEVMSLSEVSSGPDPRPCYIIYLLCSHSIFSFPCASLTRFLLCCCLITITSSTLLLPTFSSSLRPELPLQAIKTISIMISLLSWEPASSMMMEKMYRQRAAFSSSMSLGILMKK